MYRDLKPSNVMLSGERLLLIDFGIARFYRPGQARDTHVMGSPGYAAPEQYGQEQTGPRSDLYSLGALLHHLATGHEPERTPFRFPPIRQLNPSLSAGLEQVLARALALEPEGRWPDAAAMEKALLSEALPRQVHLYPVEEPEPAEYARAAAVALIVSVLCWQGPLWMGLLATGFLPLWLALLARAFQTARERSLSRIVSSAEGLEWPGGQAAWEDVLDLEGVGGGLLQERRVRVRTRSGELSFVVEDSPLPSWSPGRALARAGRLCQRIVAAAGLQGVPGKDLYRRG